MLKWYLNTKIKSSFCQYFQSLECVDEHINYVAIQKQFSVMTIQPFKGLQSDHTQMAPIEQKEHVCIAIAWDLLAIASSRTPFSLSKTATDCVLVWILLCHKMAKDWNFYQNIYNPQNTHTVPRLKCGSFFRKYNFFPYIDIPIHVIKYVLDLKLKL